MIKHVKRMLLGWGILMMLGLIIWLIRVAKLFVPLMMIGSCCALAYVIGIVGLDIFESIKKNRRNR